MKERQLGKAAQKIPGNWSRNFKDYDHGRSEALFYRWNQPDTARHEETGGKDHGRY